jgi:hypothetical protein
MGPDWKGFLGTNTLAYFAWVVNRGRLTEEEGSVHLTSLF